MTSLLNTSTTARSSGTSISHNSSYTTILLLLFCESPFPVPVGPYVTSPSSKCDDNAGAIIGGAVAVVVIIAGTIITAIIVCYNRFNKRD